MHFTAALANTDILFAFRDDPAYISFSDVSLTNLTTGSSTNLIVNGDFASGTGDDATGWTFANGDGASVSGGVVRQLRRRLSHLLVRRLHPGV